MASPFSFPTPTITFLGGPLDGHIAHPQVCDPFDIVYPDQLYTDPENESIPYLHLLLDEPPWWMTLTPEHNDPYNQVYIWEPYYQTESGQFASADG